LLLQEVAGGGYGEGGWQRLAGSPTLSGVSDKNWEISCLSHIGTITII